MLRTAVIPAAARAAARLAAAFFAALRSAAPPPAVPTAPVAAAPPAAAAGASGAAAALFCALCPLGLLLVRAGWPLIANILRSMPSTRVSRCEAATAHMHTHAQQRRQEAGRHSGRQPGPYVSAAAAHCARPSQPHVLWSQTIDKGKHGTRQHQLHQLPCSPLGATWALSSPPGSSPRPCVAAAVEVLPPALSTLPSLACRPSLASATSSSLQAAGSAAATERQCVLLCAAVCVSTVPHVAGMTVTMQGCRQPCAGSSWPAALPQHPQLLLRMAEASISVQHCTKNHFSD